MSGQQRILVIEDDPGIRDLFAETLREEGGYTVDLAGSAAEARDRFGFPSGYDLVIADWWLPDADGVALAKDAAAQGAKSFIVTGYALKLIGEAADRHELLKKPITATQLLEAVERVLGQSGAGTANRPA